MISICWVCQFEVIEVRDNRQKGACCHCYERLRKAYGYENWEREARVQIRKGKRNEIIAYLPCPTCEGGRVGVATTKSWLCGCCRKRVDNLRVPLEERKARMYARAEDVRAEARKILADRKKGIESATVKKLAGRPKSPPKPCFICGGDKNGKGAGGACSKCHARNYSRFGKQWKETCEAAIEAGNRELLLALPDGRRRRTLDIDASGKVVPLGAGAKVSGKQKLVIPKNRKQVTAEERNLEDEMRMGGPAAVALRIARRDPSRRCIPVQVGSCELTGWTMLYEPYLDGKGMVQVREMRGA